MTKEQRQPGWFSNRQLQKVCCDFALPVEFQPHVKIVNSSSPHSQQYERSAWTHLQQTAAIHLITPKTHP